LTAYFIEKAQKTVPFYFQKYFSEFFGFSGGTPPLVFYFSILEKGRRCSGKRR
jgi:hypothetical protein